jgi:hypothetical protein
MALQVDYGLEMAVSRQLSAVSFSPKANLT